MPITPPLLADPEIAAATLKQHVCTLWEGGRPSKNGWELTWIDPLHIVVKMPARRESGDVDQYHVRLGCEYYDAAPPIVHFIDPSTGAHPAKNSRWWPRIAPPPWFGLHSDYSYPTGPKRQLVCFTYSAEYYMTEHSPKDSERWQQGRHTIAATLFRLQEILSPPYYSQPSA